jgi:hypothetical protein
VYGEIVMRGRSGGRAVSFLGGEMRPRGIALLLGLALGLGLVSSALSSQPDWLSLCGQCLSPSVFSKSGIGTAKAVAEAKVTRHDAEAWCENWSPEDKACVEQQLKGEEGKSYRASADCTNGRITPSDGKSYTFAGVWTTDVGRGRSRWRDASGQVVGQDEASGGLAISQQWEMLCPAAGDLHRDAATAGEK